MKVRIVIFLILGMILTLAAQDGDYAAPEDLIRAVEEAVGGEYYERALDLISLGKERFPGDSRFPVLAGKLYEEQRLFNLALEEYSGALELDGNSPGIRYQLSRIHGYLDNNGESARLLEGLLEDPQYGTDALSDLGWMYFKLHRLRDGEALMLRELEKGFNRTYAHMLGTIYSGLYDYGKSRSYYLQSVENALAGGDSYFAAVAYYNLSLLEMSFYRYEQALEYSRLSLEQVDRASGHIARGELFQLMLDYGEARTEFQAAFDLNGDSPLALLDMADLNREFGRLEEALRQAEEIRSRRDNSWMYFYGINRMEWDRDITEVFRDIYRGLSREAAVKPGWGITGRADSLLLRAKYGWLYRYHRGRFRKLSRRLGRIQLEEDNPLHGWTLLAEGAEGYGRIALSYWKKAALFETSLSSAAEPWYDLRMGREQKDRSLLERSLGNFQLPWENSPRSEALAGAILLLKRGGIAPGEREKFLRLTGTLYGLNRGALRQRGLTLPLIIEVHGAEARSLGRMLSRFHPRGYAEFASLCYSVTLVINEGGTSSWYLRSPDGLTAGGGQRETPLLDRRGKRMLIGAIEESLYGEGM